MRVFPIVPAVLSLFVSSVAFAQAWDIYTNRENFFTLNLPAEPKETSAPYKTAKGTNLTMKTWTAPGARRARCSPAPMRCTSSTIRTRPASSPPRSRKPQRSTGQGRGQIRRREHARQPPQLAPDGGNGKRTHPDRDPDRARTTGSTSRKRQPRSAPRCRPNSRRRSRSSTRTACASAMRGSSRNIPGEVVPVTPAEHPARVGRDRRPGRGHLAQSAGGSCEAAYFRSGERVKSPRGEEAMVGTVTNAGTTITGQLLIAGPRVGQFINPRTTGRFSCSTRSPAAS